MKKTILVTGYRPFPYGSEYPNPTEEIASRLNGNKFFEDDDSRPTVEIIGRAIDVSWRTAWVVVQALVDQFKPDAVLSFGVGSNDMCFETIGHNYMDGVLDGVNETTKPGPIVLNGPYKTPSTISILPIIDYYKAREGQELQIIPNAKPRKIIPSSTSTNAGSYLCNFILYNETYHLKDILIKGFVHTPSYSKAYDGDTLVQSGALIAEAIAEFISTSKNNNTLATEPEVALIGDKYIGLSSPYSLEVRQAYAETIIKLINS